MPADKFFVKPSSFVSKNACYNFYARLSKPFKTVTRNKGIWVFYRTNHSFYTRTYESFRARGCFPVVVVRFQGDISRTALCSVACLGQSNRFGMNDVVKYISSLSGDLAVGRNNDAANQRVRADEADTFRSKVKSTCRQRQI